MDITKDLRKYMVVIIEAYEDFIPPDTLSNVTTIELMETDPQVALERAKKLIEKKNYRIHKIIENFIKPEDDTA